MQNLRIDYSASDLIFTQASLLANSAAMENSLQNPAIIAWHQHGDHAMSPCYDGANPAFWWKKYGEGNGGGMEVPVGDEFDLVLMHAEGFETVEQLPIRNRVVEDGKASICLAPMLGDRGVAIDQACVPIDEWAANQY